MIWYMKMYDSFLQNLNERMIIDHARPKSQLCDRLSVTTIVLTSINSPARRLFVQQFVQADIKENAHITGSLFGESTTDYVFDH